MSCQTEIRSKTFLSKVNLTEFKISAGHLKIMRRIVLFTLKLLLSIVVAVTLAAGSAWYALRPTDYGGQIKNGEWMTDLTTGTENAGLYQRAQIALYGLWAMSASETVYFVANTDAEGNKLDARCTYRVEGNDPDARWWSLTVYKNFHFVPNERKIYSVSQTSVQREPDNGWRIFVSPTEQAKNWLPSGGAASDDLKLLFRAYNPSASLVSQIGQAKLPKVHKEGCQ